MKTLVKPIIKNYLPVKIYLDDIEKICKAMEGDVDLIIDGIQYETLDEVKQNVKSEFAKEVEITSSKPYVTVNFNPYNVRVFFSDDTNEALCMFSKINNTITGCLRYPSKAYSFYFTWLFPFFLGILSVVLAIKKFDYVENIVDSILGFFLVWSLWVCFIRVKKHARITLKYRVETPSFLKRNADQIILILFGAILGVVLTWIVPEMVEYVSQVT